ncbi:O-methyltransferase, family 3-containing protein [Strongyloides ratti]|uniref:O-methyltransferase, family 3-containing protein n=1 Tax=Strongyloides ratti TaxID=34506 RepID=A0A090LQU6_STRRB|nr:O-methyltransferase, family 3-containing protein [Strongyloides ratti]CEF70551.1 O-methyltransferase, family 3-containing protein [Strongyloides ratti]
MLNFFLTKIKRKTIRKENGTKKVQLYCDKMNCKESEFLMKYRDECIKYAIMLKNIPSPEVLNIGKIFIQAIEANKILDIRSFFGLSTNAWSEALISGGEIISVDLDHSIKKKIEKNINVTKNNYSNKEITIKDIEEDPLQFLDKMVSNTENLNKFDFIFINDDGKKYSKYYEQTMKLISPGGIIIFNNVLSSSKVADYKNINEEAIALRNLNNIISNDSRCNNILLNIDDGLHIVFKHKI